jgi:hypothetical protein
VLLMILVHLTMQTDNFRPNIGTHLSLANVITTGSTEDTGYRLH